MNNKKLKTASIVALALVGVSLIFTFVLLLLGVYGNSLIKVEGGTGDPSTDLGQGIGMACTISIHIIFVAFTMIVKLVSLLVGLSSCFARKKRAAIITVAVFTCIITALSAVIGAFTLSVYPEIAAGNANSTLVYIALILMPLTDLLWGAVAISRAVILSNKAKQNAKVEEENQVLEPVIIGEEGSDNNG